MTRSLLVLGLLLPALVTHVPAQVSWIPRSPAVQPSARTGPSMAFDALRDRTVMFGGRSALVLERDTWEWDGSTWSQVQASGGPSPRSGHAMVFHRNSGRTVMFGGANSQFLNDTWEWDGTAWSRRQPTAPIPGRRSMHALAYDEARDRTVMFGGFASVGIILDDTWEWDGTVWTRRQPARSPSPRYTHAMAYDRARARTVLFGGSPLTAETWEWDGNQWTERFPASAPPALATHHMVYDEARQRVVLFGGVDVAGSSRAETWEWDGQNWIQRQTARTPSPRCCQGMAYDSTRSRVVLFSGGQPQIGPPILFGDTWEYEPVSPARYAPFGNGCAGSAGVPVLAAAQGSLPWTGDPFAVDVNGLPMGSGVALMVLGLSRAATPVDLGPVGMPGCLAFLDLNAPVDVRLLTGSGGVATWRSQIPAISILAGTAFYHQALVLDPVVSNAAGAVVSNPGEGRVGNK